MSSDTKEIIEKIISSHDTRPHFERIKHLIQQEGVDIDQVSSFDYTLLTVAVLCGDLDCVKFLIENGANIQHQTKYKSTPLHFAALKGHFDVVKYLIQNGAAIDAITEWNNTPLLYASRDGHVDVIQYLLDMGANHSIPDKYGKTPLQAAEQRNKTQVVDLLRQHTQEKVEIGKQQRLQQAQKQKEEEQEQQDEGSDDPLCLDGTVIQSSDEIKLAIAHLEKQLELFWFSDQHLDSASMQKEWLKANKRQYTAFITIDQQGKLPSLEDLLNQVEALEHEMNQYARKHFVDWSSNINHCCQNVKEEEDDDSMINMGLDHNVYKSKMQNEILRLYSVYTSAQMALEQRSIAMAQF